MAVAHNPAMPDFQSTRSSPGGIFLVADVGNSRIKLAAVADLGDGARVLPTVHRRQDLSSRDVRPETLRQWLVGAAPGAAVMLVASVHEAAATRLEAAIAEVSATQHRPLRRRRVNHADLAIEVRLAEPRAVGIDRIAAAAAARVVKGPGRPAIIVDCGTAATVDVVSAAGEFLGGAILPGPALMTRALAEGTSRLPEVAALEHGTVPPMPGRSTQEAIAAGIGWGMRGAIARLVEEARRGLGAGAEPEIILTGGWRTAVRDALPGAREMPDLVLAGIALAARRG